MPSTQPPTSYRASQIWSPKDDETLLHARKQGHNWQPIASRYFPDKTPNACRKRHERLQEKRNAEEYDTVKFEDLARAYMEVRKEMWTILAARLRESNWNLVEEKCMSRGLKNLQAAARSPRRGGCRVSSDAGDSGIFIDDNDHMVELAPPPAQYRTLRPQPPPERRASHRHSYGAPTIQFLSQ